MYLFHELLEDPLDPGALITSICPHIQLQADAPKRKLIAGLTLRLNGLLFAILESGSLQTQAWHRKLQGCNVC